MKRTVGLKILNGAAALVMLGGGFDLLILYYPYGNLATGLVGKAQH